MEVLNNANVQGCCLKATPCLFIIPCYYHSFIEACIELLHGLEKYRFFSLSCIETGSGALINHMVAIMLHCSKSCFKTKMNVFYNTTTLCLFFFLSFYYSFIEEFIKALLNGFRMYWFFHCIEPAGEVLNSTIISWSR